jgi:glycosyltransferase involved in cell wall biosynthesis
MIEVDIPMTKPLKILIPCLKDFFVSKGNAFTGAQHFTSNFFDYFDQTPHTLIGIAFTNPPEKKSIKIKTQKREGKPWLDVNIRVLTTEILRYAQGEPDPELNAMIDDIAEAFRKTQADIFFMNGLSALTYVLFRAAERAGIPIVTVHHGIWSLESQAFTAISKKSLQQRRNMERQLVRGSVQNIFLTQLSYRIFALTIGRVPRRQRRFITLPYNPVFADKKVPRSRPHQNLRIGLIGRWDPVKNHEAYLNLAKEARRQQLPWEFFAATAINPDLPALKPILEEYTAYISVRAHMTPQKLKLFYRSLDVIVVPSLIETFCGVVMEAVLQHKPVLIAPRVGWADTFKEYGLRRWVMPFHNPRRVIRRIKRLAGQTPPPALINDVLKHNHPEAVFAEYEKLFTEVAGK